MLVVGPSQCGKTHFVEKVLTENCIKFPDNKPQQIIWFYNQWQKRYDQLQRRLGDKIVFERGIPELSDDLNEISLNIEAVTAAYLRQICLVLSSLFSFAHSFHNLFRHLISNSVRFLCIISFVFRSSCKFHRLF